MKNRRRLDCMKIREIVVNKYTMISVSIRTGDNKPFWFSKKCFVSILEFKLMFDPTIDSLSTTLNTQKLLSGIFLFQLVNGQKTVYFEKLFVNKE